MFSPNGGTTWCSVGQQPIGRVRDLALGPRAEGQSMTLDQVMTRIVGSPRESVIGAEELE